MAIPNPAGSGCVGPDGEGSRSADAPLRSDAQPIGSEILARLRDGDPDALGELMAAYWKPLVGYVAGTLSSRDAVEDVVQETFVRLWQNRSGLTPSGSPRALLYRIARNLVFKLHRHKGVRRSKEHELRHFLTRGVESPLERVVANEARDILKAAIEKLPERRREAFVLLRWHGFSLKEAAEVMGLSTQTVANHAALAMKQLKECLQSYRHE